MVEFLFLLVLLLPIIPFIHYLPFSGGVKTKVVFIAIPLIFSALALLALKHLALWKVIVIVLLLLVCCSYVLATRWKNVLFAEGNPSPFMAVGVTAEEEVKKGMGLAEFDAHPKIPLELSVKEEEFNNPIEYTSVFEEDKTPLLTEVAEEIPDSEEPEDLQTNQVEKVQSIEDDNEEVGEWDNLEPIQPIEECLSSSSTEELSEMEKMILELDEDPVQTEQEPVVVREAVDKERQAFLEEVEDESIEMDDYIEPQDAEERGKHL